MGTQQTAFLNSQGIITPRQVRQSNFQKWMRYKVKSVFYNETERMAKAIEKVE